MTNYFHLLGLGHISKPIYILTNLGKRLNKIVQRFYLAKTQRGDHSKYKMKGIEYACPPQTKPLARLIQD